MKYSIIRRHGNSENLDSLPDERIYELLSELDDGDVDTEHGDVWMSENSSGWSLGRFGGNRALMVLENTETGGSSFHRSGVSQEEAFRLFRKLADGEIEGILAERWSPGCGS